MQDDEVARVQALRALGREIPATELANEMMGAGTVKVLKAFQTAPISLTIRLSGTPTRSSLR
jgi:hypothetical protein